MANNRENLGPAERIINSLLTYTDHCYHNRPGLVTADGRFAVGVRWEPVTHKVENDEKIVYKLTKVGKKQTRTRAGVLRDDGKVYEANALVGEYREAGLFPEVVTWFYRQAIEVWKLDNEFAARWASFAFGQEHKDLKVVLAALMLVQNRKGDPVKDAGKVAFFDDDYRDVGEAMMLIRRKDDKALDPKMLLRIRDVLMLSTVAALNHEQGFGGSARKPFLGRWPRVVEKYLRQREENPKVLEAQLKAGYKSQLMDLAQRVGYKPQAPVFFEALRWRQQQADDGRRALKIGEAVAAATTWEGLTEAQICEKITVEKLDWKRITSLLPKTVGVTRAVMAAAIESKSLSDRDLLIYTPTLEELGLLNVPDIRVRWEKATQAATDTRALNIARNVQSKEVKEKLADAADMAIKKAVEEVTRNMRIYFMVDISGSMKNAIDAAKACVAKFLQGFPAERLHVAVFNTQGRIVQIKHASAAGVENAFKGIQADGGTDYGSGVRVLQEFKPKDDEDSLFIFVGDEEAPVFDEAVRHSGLRPMAFGFLKTVPNGGAAGWRAQQYGVDRNEAVRSTATRLSIPCFMIDERTFDDPYAIPRTIRALVASTPVNQTVARAVATPRVTIIDTILKTELLQKPAWA